MKDTEGLVPPHDLTAEQSVLGAALQGRQSPMDALTPEMFYWEKHQAIFGVMLDLRKRREPVDITTVGAELTAKGITERIGGYYYLTELTEATPFPSNVGSYERIVRQTWVGRETHKILVEQAGQAWEPGADSAKVLDETVQRILDLQRGLGSRAAHVAEILEKTMSGIQASINDDPSSGIRFYRPKIDKMFGRLRAGSTNIVAGESSSGKSAFVHDMAMRWGLNGVHVGISSSEMLGDEIEERMLSYLAFTKFGVSVPYASMNAGGRKAKDNWETIQKSGDVLRDLPIWIIDKSKGKITVPVLRREFTRLMAQHKSDRWVFIVDYAQILDVDNTRISREQQVSQISGGLKDIATRLQAPIVVLSQLNRERNYRDGGKMPTLDSLRESGALGNDAHKVMILWENNPQEKKTVKNEDTGEFEDVKVPRYDDSKEPVPYYLRFVKNRGGLRGTANLLFRKPFALFTDSEEEQDLPRWIDYEHKAPRPIAEAEATPF